MEQNISHPAGLKKWAPLMILSLALTIIILDTTILNVSLKAIINDFQTDVKSIQWVISAYSLMLAAFTITGGRLGDFFGRKKMFVYGAFIFAIGSLITSISTSVGMMIFSEAIINGIGACLMLPATVSLLVSHYQGRDRQMAFGVWGGLAAASAAFGPVVGGFLTTYYSWRYAFRINIIVAIVLGLGSIFIRESKDTEERAEIDYGGIILSALGLFSIVFGAIEASTYGWWDVKEPFMVFGQPVLGLGDISATPFFLVLGIDILVLFFLWELRRTRQHKTPLVSFKLFQNRQFTVAASITSVLAFIQTGVFFAMPVFLQGVRHLDSLHTGFALLPMTLALLFSAPFSAYMGKFVKPKHIVQLGLLLNIFGCLLLWSELGINADQWTLTPGLIVFGLGMGCMFSQITNIALSAVSVQESGEASGVNTTMRQLGATLGSAILGAILLSTVSTSLNNQIQVSTVIPEQYKPAIVEAAKQQASSIEINGGSGLSASNTPTNIKQEIATIVDQATVDGNQKALLFSLGFIIFGLLLSIFLPNRKSSELQVSHSLKVD